MSDTPRTTAAIDAALAEPGMAASFDAAVEIAQILERELAIVTADRNGVMEINGRHRGRIAELERENATLREDKARLDWMAARGMKWLGGNTLTREQIDAARKANP